jgi:tetratricopeptide (TPR) repeat protein
MGRVKLDLLCGVLLGAAALLAGGARAACRVEAMLEIPVTMTDGQPIVAARINGKDVKLLADSGAFFSQISPPEAAELGLKPGPLPLGFRVIGVGGAEASPGFATAKDFSINGTKLAGAFVVGGGEVGHGNAGVMGQNILGFADVEYDLAHGVIRLMRPHDCLGRSLAYWSGASPSAIDIEAAKARMTKGEASVNGVRVRVLFDTGASTSGLGLVAARRAGLDPHGSDATSAGMTRGVGRRLVQTWIVPVDSFKMGGEEIKHTRLRVADTDFGAEDVDMLLGADFFLSHRVYVANDQRKLYFTYNGGPVFNLDIAPGAGSAAPSAESKANEPTDAAGLARRGAASASRKEYDKAIADLSKAVALAPDNADYLFERARSYQGNNQPFLAMADLNRSLELRPDDVTALTTRALFELAGHDKLHALADLAAADRLAAKGADSRLEMAQVYMIAPEPSLSVTQLDMWIVAHPDDSRMGPALATRCYARGLLGRDLDLALADCEGALKRDRKSAQALDARGLVRLRRGEFDLAITDYDAVLALQPRAALSLYGRGLAKLRKGMTAEGKTDIAAATVLRPGVTEQAKAFGLAP